MARDAFVRCGWDLFAYPLIAQSCRMPASIIANHSFLAT